MTKRRIDEAAATVAYTPAAKRQELLWSCVETSGAPVQFTGSRVYGLPGPFSDIDMVVLVHEQTAEVLRALASADCTCEEYEQVGASCVLRFGELNLIVETDPARYEVWVQGTAELAARRPVGRKDAIQFFHELRRKAGLSGYNKSSKS